MPSEEGGREKLRVLALQREDVTLGSRGAMVELRLRAATPGGLSPPCPLAALKLTPTCPERPPLTSPQELLARPDEQQPALFGGLGHLGVLGTTRETKFILLAPSLPHTPHPLSALPGEG